MGRASRRRAEQRAAATQRPVRARDDADRLGRVWDVVGRGPVRRPPHRLPPPGAGPGLHRLQDLVGMRLEIDRAIGDGVAALVGLGTDWGSIGRALGVSRQAARQRYGASGR